MLFDVIGAGAWGKWKNNNNNIKMVNGEEKMEGYPQWLVGERRSSKSSKSFGRKEGMMRREKEAAFGERKET